MNWSGWIACWIVSADCVGRALGQEPQRIFADGMAWLFWIPAVIWLLVGFGFFCRAAGGAFGYDE